MAKKESDLTPTGNAIVIGFATVGIAASMAAMFALQIRGAIPGALFGACGAVVGAGLGRLIAMVAGQKK